MPAIDNAWLYERVKIGRQTPDHIRFVTWTTRYNRDYWIAVDGLDKHYERAEVDATRSADRAKYEITTKNISRWLVGDTDVDMRAAIAAGCTPILVGPGPAEADLLKDVPPALRCHNCGDLAGFVRKELSTISV